MLRIWGISISRGNDWKPVAQGTVGDSPSARDCDFYLFQPNRPCSQLMAGFRQTPPPEKNIWRREVRILG